MYQGNGIIGVSKQKSRHPPFYSIVFFSYYRLVPLSIIFILFRNIQSWKQNSSVYIRYFNRSLLVRTSKRPLIAIITSRRQISLDLQKSLNLNIVSYFINTLASPHANTWHHRGGPITHTIDRFGFNPNHWRSVEHTYKIVISCIDQGVKYTGINVTKKHGIPYLLSSFYEINMLANSMQNRLGLCYTTLLINFHSSDT